MPGTADQFFFLMYDYHLSRATRHEMVTLGLAESVARTIVGDDNHAHTAWTRCFLPQHGPVPDQ